jgi:hypothetical protein
VLPEISRDLKILANGFLFVGQGEIKNIDALPLITTLPSSTINPRTPIKEN